MHEALNGQGVDLAQVKALAAARDQLESQRPQITAQLLTQAALICACGAPMPADPIVYFRAEQAEQMTAQGPAVGLNLVVHVRCSRKCAAIGDLEDTAAARKRGQHGQPVLLAAGREAVRTLAHADQVS